MPTRKQSIERFILKIDRIYIFYDVITTLYNMSKFIIKISTTGVDCTKDEIYRIVFKEVGTDLKYDIWFKVDTSLIASHPLLSDVEKGKILVAIEEEGVTIEYVYPMLKELLEKNDIIGFSVSFDIKFILYKCAQIGKTIDIFNTKFIDLLTVERSVLKFDLISVMNRHFIPSYLPGFYAFDESRRYDADYVATRLEDLYKAMCTDEKTEYGSRLLSERGILVEQNKAILFGMGKHQGERIGEVIRKDFEYIKWLFDNTDFFTRQTIAYVIKKLKEIADAKKKSTQNQ